MTETAAAAGAMVYLIDNTKSQASFTLNEKLMGTPTTVVGVTPKVNGQIEIDWANPANTKVGKIEIDATDFKTDNERRNGAIQRFILQTDQFPMVTFEPTAIEGLPATVAAGDALTFKVTGNMTVRNITVPVTFDVTANAKSESEIEGTATTQITRTAFQLTIPSVPSVADVTDEVALELKFVAAKQ
jgi:polyisoprenoid-binding protein YceI